MLPDINNAEVQIVLLDTDEYDSIACLIKPIADMSSISTFFKDVDTSPKPASILFGMVSVR